MQRPPDQSGVASDQAQSTVELVEEEARVDKHENVTGRVRVSSVTEIVNETGKQSLLTAKVRIERIDVGKIVKDVPTTRVEGDVTIIPVVEEVLVLEKRLLLKEELHVFHESSAEEVEYSIPLRKQRAVIERDDEQT